MTRQLRLGEEVSRCLGCRVPTKKKRGAGEKEPNVWRRLKGAVDGFWEGIKVPTWTLTTPKSNREMKEIKAGGCVGCVVDCTVVDGKVK